MPEDLPKTVLVDERRLNQVLLNLLGNAVKFTNAGQVTLRVQVLPDGAANASRVRFAVEDTGPGIEATELEKIFQPFEQAGAVEQRMGGTGLGLAISRRIVQLMGSDILVQSEVGRGSSFWFELRLPLAQPGFAPEKDTYRSITGYEGPNKTLLVVDDSQANRDIAASVLAMAGFRMLEACDGQEALEQVRAHKPDLVLMDLRMPRTNGLEAMEYLRKSPQFASLPIIAVSASSYPSDQQRALEAGATDFLPKPLDFNRLFDTLRALLGLQWRNGARVPCAV